MKVLVLGASGMIGSTMVQVLSDSDGIEVIGTLRSEMVRPLFPASIAKKMLSGVDLIDSDNIARLLQGVRPSVVINCAGLTKHVSGGNHPLLALSMNALLPHRLAEYCGMIGARLIQVSTDCVFSGARGNYSEDDQPDAIDFYGKSKHLGEVLGQHCLTLRTSTIGRELGTRRGLLEWFLMQRECKGYSRAIFSGLPTVEFARIVRDLVIPNRGLSGLYHVGARPIDKNRLLHLIGLTYGKDISIVPDDEVRIDRSLDARRFNLATGYRPPEWPKLIEMMRDYPT